MEETLGVVKLSDESPRIFKNEVLEFRVDFFCGIDTFKRAKPVHSVARRLIKFDLAVARYEHILFVELIPEEAKGHDDPDIYQKPVFEFHLNTPAPIVGQQQ
ncbi:MAG: hypothetical protein HY042_05695 [Spirochaetia bacterium]|nr:hypothetical protein [Spirochaetia bacterium]